MHERNFAVVVPIPVVIPLLVWIVSNIATIYADERVYENGLAFVMILIPVPVPILVHTLVPVLHFDLLPALVPVAALIVVDPTMAKTHAYGQFYESVVRALVAVFVLVDPTTAMTYAGERVYASFVLALVVEIRVLVDFAVAKH